MGASSARVKLEAIFAYLERRRRNWTIVVDPTKLSDIKRLKDVHGPYR
jgi:hypothetical protein